MVTFPPALSTPAFTDSATVGDDGDDEGGNDNGGGESGDDMGQTYVLRRGGTSYR